MFVSCLFLIAAVKLSRHLRYKELYERVNGEYDKAVDVYQAARREAADDESKAASIGEAPERPDQTELESFFEIWEKREKLILSAVYLPIACVFASPWIGILAVICFGMYFSYTNIVRDSCRAFGLGERKYFDTAHIGMSGLILLLFGFLFFVLEHQRELTSAYFQCLQNPLFAVGTVYFVTGLIELGSRTWGPRLRAEHDEKDEKNVSPGIITANVFGVLAILGLFSARHSSVHPWVVVSSAMMALSLHLSLH